MIIKDNPQVDKVKGQYSHKVLKYIQRIKPKKNSKFYDVVMVMKKL